MFEKIKNKQIVINIATYNKANVLFSCRSKIEKKSVEKKLRKKSRKFQPKFQ